MAQFKLSSAFLIWRAYSITRHRKTYPNKRRSMTTADCSVKSSEHSLRKYAFHRSDFISKGAKIICRLLFHRRQKTLHEYFHNWRREIRCRLLMLLRCWHLWNNSIAQSKLMKMTARRFLVIAYKPLLKVFRVVSGENKREAWRRWVLCVQVLRSLEQQKIRLKLLFQCWKLTTVASIDGKKQLRKVDLLSLLNLPPWHCMYIGTIAAGHAGASGQCQCSRSGVWPAIQRPTRQSRRREEPA